MNRMKKKDMTKDKLLENDRMKTARDRLEKMLKLIKDPKPKSYKRISTKGTWKKTSVVTQSATYPADHD